VENGPCARRIGRIIPIFHTQVVHARKTLGIPIHRLSTREEEVIRCVPYPSPQKTPLPEDSRTEFC